MEEMLKEILQTLNEFRNENEERWKANEKRWEENDKRWEANEKRWKETEQRLAKIEKNGKETERRLTEIDKNFSKVFKEIEEIKERLPEEGFEEKLELRLQKLEANQRYYERVQEMHDNTLYRHTNRINKIRKTTDQLLEKQAS